MTVKLGVVMDPIQSINPKKDSTLAMLQAAQAKGWQLYSIEQQGLFLTNNDVFAHRRRISVRDQKDSRDKTDSCEQPNSRDPAGWFTDLETDTAPLTDMDLVLLRKDPPFDMEYVYTTYLLELAEKKGVPIINRPSSVRDSNEKLLALQFPQCCPPSLVSRDPPTLRSFYQQHGDVVFKPLDGMGGASIFKVSRGDKNLGVIIETLTDRGKRQAMVQKFIPEISAGDTRILLIDGKPIPYGLARIPIEGENRGNLAAGGSGVGRELNERDLFICDQVGQTVADQGLHFVGIDVIGDYLTEINVTCPTCIRELNKAFDLDIAGDFMNFLENRFLR